MSAGAGPLPLAVIVLGSGVAARVLADRIKIPSVLLSILAGTGVGAEGPDLIGSECSAGSIPRRGAWPSR